MCVSGGDPQTPVSLARAVRRQRLVGGADVLADLVAAVRTTPPGLTPEVVVTRPPADARRAGLAPTGVGLGVAVRAARTKAMATRETKARASSTRGHAATRLAMLASEVSENMG